VNVSPGVSGDFPLGGGHRPVMLAEMLDAIGPRDGEVYVDGTFGAGGYSVALLDAADCRVWGIDRDPDAVARGAEMTKIYDGRLTVMQGRYGDMDDLLAARGVGPVNGVALDIGVSSMQIDEAERGFSFRHDGPLDMRMEKSGPSAADVVNQTDEAPLADIIYRYGEERASRRIAHAIVEARRETPITRTVQLADIVRRASRRPMKNRGKNRGKDRGKTIDPATRTFQALRIYVNDELGQLRRGLSAAEAILAPGGRLAVVSFHSLEDREVKNFFQDRTGRNPRGSRHLPEATGAAETTGAAPPTFRVTARGAVRPGDDEININPRARSARLRTAQRNDNPADGPHGDPS
jgi:16S rRNA (cytosine1402-N4)-methyltransferase